MIPTALRLVRFLPYVALAAMVVQFWFLWQSNERRAVEVARLEAAVEAAETAAEDLRIEAEAELTAAVERAERIVANERAAAQRAQERAAALAAAQDECLDTSLPSELWD